MNDEKKNVLLKVIEKAEALLGIEKEAKLEEDVKLEQMQLEDGGMIEADAFEAGQAVFIVNEDERTPLPVGSYMLSDGMELVVEEEGVIASIGEPVAEEEMSQEFVTVEQFNNFVEEVKSMLSDQKAVEELSAQIDKLSEANEELSKEKEELSEQLKEPAVEPLKKAPKEVELKTATTAKGRIMDGIREAKNNQ